jgi:7-cyano-7-deazaguanine synthase
LIVDFITTYMTNKHAVVLLSGGLDSATTLACAMADGYFIHIMTFDYGQRHARELEAAKKIVEFYIIEDHAIVNLNLQSFGVSTLLDKSKELPTNRPLNELAGDIPSTYVPGRNLILLSCAVSWAESIGAEAVYIGVNSIDYSGYPDCRPEFLTAFERAVELGTKTGVEGNKIEIKYPLINMTKAEIIKRGSQLGVPYHLTWSCYSGGEAACGVCDSCQLRLKGFKDAGLQDPIKYQNEITIQ